MTTTVHIAVSGNKAVEVLKSEAPDGDLKALAILKPGQFTTQYVHGSQSIVVRETGDFLT